MEERPYGTFPGHLHREEFDAAAESRLIEELVLHEVVFAVLDVVVGDVDEGLVHDADMGHESHDFALSDRKISDHAEGNLQVAALHRLPAHEDGVEGVGFIMPFEKHVLQAQFTEHILVAASREEAEGAGKNVLQLVEVRQLAVADDEVGAEAEADMQIGFQLLVLQLDFLAAHRGGDGKGASQ